MWFQAEIFFKVFSVFDLNRIPGISNIQNCVFIVWMEIPDYHMPDKYTCSLNLVCSKISCLE